jgi:hypothetical protein
MINVIFGYDEHYTLIGLKGSFLMCFTRSLFLKALCHFAFETSVNFNCLVHIRLYMIYNISFHMVI